MSRIVFILVLLILATATHAQQPAKQVEVVNDPLLVEVINDTAVEVINEDPIPVEVVNPSPSGSTRTVLRDSSGQVVGAVATFLEPPTISEQVPVILNLNGESVAITADQTRFYGWEGFVPPEGGDSRFESSMRQLSSRR
jgi:hypothetical protein